jgi:uncharacterized protein YbcI
MVALHRKQFGRGAGAAKSFIVDDMVVCVLSDVYTQVEKTLIEAGKTEHVRETRQLHQLALGAEYRAAVESATGRKVQAFVSAVHFDPDMAFEIFLLEPVGDQDGASRKTSTE